MKFRIVGFEDLGMSDSFQTSTLEKRLATCKVITDSSEIFDKPAPRKTIFGFAEKNYDEDEDEY